MCVSTNNIQRSSAVLFISVSIQQQECKPTSLLYTTT